MLDIIIPGEPVAKGRPRVALIGGRPRAYTPAKTAAWEKMAATLLRGHWHKVSLAEPVIVKVDCVFKRPKRLLRKRDPEERVIKATKPDVDNCIKAALDSAVLSGVLVDDSWVVSVTATKWYAAKGEAEHVRLVIEPWTWGVTDDSVSCG